MSIFVPNKAKIPLIIMLIGIPGSGKSCFAREISQNLKVTTHSSDNLRLELFGSVNDMSRNTELFHELHSRIRADLMNGNSVVYDATNIHAKYRYEFLKTLNGINCFKIAVYMNTSLNKCLKNNNGRDHFVPEDRIHTMLDSLELPSIEEGFDKVVKIDEYKYDEFYEVMQSCGYTNNSTV